MQPYTLELMYQGQKLILEQLRLGAMSMDQMIEFLKMKEIPYARRIAKEVAWSLSEEGLAEFNYNWMLELTDAGWSAILGEVERETRDV